MKLTALIFAHLLREFATKVNYRLGLLLTTDEEIGGTLGARRIVVDEGIGAKFVVVGETSTSLSDVCTDLKWFARVRVDFGGRAGHEAYQWETLNALSRLARYVVAVETAYPVLAKEEWRTTAAVTLMQCDNREWNKIPDAATAGFGFRFTADDQNFISPETLMKFLIGLRADDMTFPGLSWWNLQCKHRMIIPHCNNYYIRWEKPLIKSPAALKDTDQVMVGILEKVRLSTDFAVEAAILDMNLPTYYRSRHLGKSWDDFSLIIFRHASDRRLLIR
jgi:Peptidase dimerisation domain